MFIYIFSTRLYVSSGWLCVQPRVFPSCFRPVAAQTIVTNQMPFAATQMEPAMIILNDLSQKDKYYNATMWNLKKWCKWTY